MSYRAQLPLRLKTTGQTAGARVENQIDCSGPFFTQRTSRKQPTVANASFVHDAYFDVSFQSPVLQAIVTNQGRYLRMSGQQGPACFNAGQTYPDRHACFLANEQRFIAHGFGKIAREDFARVTGLTAMASGNHAHCQTFVLQVLNQGHCHRRFPRASGHNVAHHNDPCGQAMPAFEADLVEARA